ncbi:hypothetical protein NQ314_021002 [Rhamnusium bicolor]|uniref:Uncharacterized protein n=1 Tax=Rhamnusium bicolor TaxID=1586634 RepID=A0AAV8WJI9_9CUCU|nr:hypothetical protein NQ314_021002 [Rhamnusium bicolor]
MLMPPPLDTKSSLNAIPDAPSPVITQRSTTPMIIYTTPTPTSTSTLTPTSTSSVTVQAANLVYQSSSLTDGSEWNTNKNKYATAAPSVSWEPPNTTKKNIPDYREELVYNTHLAPPESFIHIEFAPHNFTNKPLLAADSNHNINYVTPPPLIKMPSKEVMFKGQVSDDNLDISNTYVKIGKPEAEVHSTGLGMPNVETIIQHPLPIVSSDVVMFPHMNKPSLISNNSPQPNIPPLNMQTIEDMQTMHPPPVTQSPVFTKSTNAIIKILEKEKSRPIIFKDLSSVPETPNYTGSSSAMTNTYVTLPTSTAEMVTTTSTIEPPTTSTTSLTTDPLFKHYKQPIEPMKGPLYLIIQGHSKVKTYGPSKQFNGILVQESNEISDDKYEKGDFEVKHLHGFHNDMKLEEQSRKGRSGNIQTLKHVIQTGLGAIDFSGVDEIKKRSDGSFQEAELQVGYKVSDEKDATTETYHKGFVEEARKLKL